MDPRYNGELLKHLEKQHEFLMNAQCSMNEELRKLQVEEEMLMRKFYELMSALGLTKKSGSNYNVPNTGEVGEFTTTDSTNAPTDYDIGQSTKTFDSAVEIVPFEAVVEKDSNEHK